MVSTWHEHSTRPIYLEDSLGCSTSRTIVICKVFMLTYPIISRMGGDFCLTMGPKVPGDTD